MLKFKFYILLFLTTSIKCVVLKQLNKCKIEFLFINNPFYSKNLPHNKKLYYNYSNEELQHKYDLNKYTLNNNFVLYARKAKTEDKETKPTKKVTRKTKKILESAPKSELTKEPKLDTNKELENDYDLNVDINPEFTEPIIDNNEGDNELVISKRMLSSVLSLTSSLYTPDFYDIIPILYNIKDDILNITDNIGDQFKQDNKVLDKKKKITGLFVENDEGVIDKLLLSIPSSILERLSQSSKYGSKVESTDSPLQLISLGSGFFSKVYQITVFPYLSEVSQKAFNTELDHTYGFMEYIISSFSDSKNYKENNLHELKPIEKEEFETVFKDFKINKNKDFDISLFKESTLKSLSILIKCIKDLVYFNSCILLLEQLLGRKPTDKEILYSFRLDSIFENNVDNKDNLNNNDKVDNDNLSNINTSNNNLINIKNKNKEYDIINYHMEMRNKLVDIINYSEDEIEYRIDRFFTPFLEVVIERFEKRVSKQNYFFKIMVTCLKDALNGMRSRLYGVYPNMIMHLENNFIGQLFKIAYHQVRTSAIKQNLPMHLPLSTLRLAKKAFTVYDNLQYLQYNIILKYHNNLIDLKNIPSIDSIFGNNVENKDNLNNNSLNDSSSNININASDNILSNINTTNDIKNNKNKKDKINIDDKIYKEFVSAVLKIENKFKNREGDESCNDYMRRQQQEKLLDETVAKVLNVTVDRLIEAIDAYKVKEVSPREKMPKYLKMRLSNSGMLASMSGYYSDMYPSKIYSEKEDIDLVKQNVYRKTLRKLAIEAIDDRLTRLLYMSHNDLFLDINPDYNEIIEQLEIPKKTADFIVFTASLICREYEVWRIKLNLPPYVNEFNVNPGILKDCNLDPFNLPYHISTAVYNDLKRNIYSSVFKDDPTLSIGKGPKKNKRDTYNRMRLIKPNMSSVNDLLMNYKQNYKEYEKILQKSPIEYLKPSGLYEDI